MGLITDIILAFPIGIIYNMIIHESTDILNNKFNYADRVQKSLLIVSGGGLFGLIFAMFFLSNGLENRAIKYGLLFGSFLLLFHSIICNWQTMQNDTRIIIMVLTLCVLMWYSYVSNSNLKKYHPDYDNKDDSDDYIYEDGKKMSQFLPVTYYEQMKTNKK